MQGNLLTETIKYNIEELKRKFPEEPYGSHYAAICCFAWV